MRVVLGEGDEAYQRIVDTYENMVIGKHARVIILNVLHPKMPKLVLLLMPTCNRFTHQLVQTQWEEIIYLCRTHLSDLITLIGHASDGDGHRRKLRLELLETDGFDQTHFRPIPAHLGFHLCATKVEDEEAPSGFCIEGLGDQDPIHNHKKVINHIDHTSRTLTAGRYFIDSNHLLLLFEKQSSLHHGLKRTHVIRKDRQNWKICQEITFVKVQSCLQDIIDGRDGHPPDTSVLGTLKYLEITHYYMDIFHSPLLSFADRICNASVVITFLGIWRNFVDLSVNLSRKTNFLSHETYSDFLISCHSAVSLICFMRDTCPHLPCYLSEMGSDCCEKFFSRNGQWQGNHHTYDFYTMTTNLLHMICL